MDRVERRITKRHEIDKNRQKYAERFHEFASLGDYKESMIRTYMKTKREQEKDNNPK